MNRANAIPIVVALVCILSMGLAASTLLSAQMVGSDGETTPMQTQRPMDWVGIDDPNEPAEGELNETIDDGSNMSGITTCVPALNTTPVLLGLLIGFFSLAFLVYLKFNVAIAMLAGWTAFPPLMLVYFMLTDCSSRDDGAIGGINVGNVPIEDAGSQIVPISNIPVWVVPLLVGTIILGAAFVLYRSAGTDEIVIPEDTDDDEPDLDSFARAAGRAADRIEEHNADADNAVYQAWVEMTSLLDVDHSETYTAGEFADAAIDLGMASDDVSELTTLFNEVRYGGKDAETRSDRAVDTLRTIESQYREEAKSTNPDQTVTNTEPTDGTEDDNR